MKNWNILIKLPNPVMLWVEPSAACNLDCEGCPTAAGRLGGNMSLDTFVKILDRIPKSVRLLNMWHRGEPLAAPDFPEMIAEATQRKMKTQTHSNGILLNKKDIAYKIVESGLSRISIGVDGIDQKTYSRIRTGGKLAEVHSGIRILANIKKQTNKRQPKIVVECLLSNQNHEQFEQIRLTALSLGADEVKFKTFRLSNLDHPEAARRVLPEDDKLWRYKTINDEMKPKRRYSSCLRVAFSAAIAYDGSVLPCCFDAKAEFKLGNILTTPWHEIWSGTKFNIFRKSVMKRGGYKPEICYNCTEGLNRLYVPTNYVIKSTSRLKRKPALSPMIQED